MYSPSFDTRTLCCVIGTRAYMAMTVSCRVAQMKEGCILINVSRGGLVENAALLSGLESRQIGGLGMDVYENEGQ